MKEIPLARSDITEREIEAVVRVLRTPHLSLGPKLGEFEERLAEYAGVKHAVAVNSGTSALHLIIKALGIGKGDEVITTPFSFVASANCILFESARPVFVDIDPQAWNIDTDLIEEKITNNTKAILAVDVFGYPADWDRLREIAERYNLRLIEDSAEALGAEYKGRRAGSFGDGAVFAFYPNKQITTGEGGAILIHDEEMAELCRSLRNQGRSKGGGWLEHERLGYNYRLSDINCALGIAQLERVDELLSKREWVAQLYNERLKEIDGIEIPYTSPDVKKSWFVYVVRLNDDFAQGDRDKILKELRGRGIECSNYFGPIHLQPFYRKMFGYQEGDFSVTEQIAARTIALPFYGNLNEKEIDYVCDNLGRLVKSGV
ncbi:MAG: DegT/DnrJ/EryC1/StrS family aminotransferase [Deltaproteobacteria bacterium]|nr:DegT/DnrJ/EryC1/StrS family aminotransferase [Deltaproteobacteria bacterium]